MYYIEYKYDDIWTRLPEPFNSCAEADRGVKALQASDNNDKWLNSDKFEYNVIFVGELHNYSNDAPLPVIDKQPVDHVLIDEVV